MNEITLKNSSDVSQRIEILKLLHRKPEEKVNHSDMFRQRNMNYALVIFAAFITMGIKLDSQLSQVILAFTLFTLMAIFCIWDRRWHLTKHGWEYSSCVFYEKMCHITNDSMQEISYKFYYKEREQTAEWFSVQPIVFYFLLAASIASFFIFESFKSHA
jgi:hypothetical protein